MADKTWDSFSLCVYLSVSGSLSYCLSHRARRDGGGGCHALGVDAGEKLLPVLLRLPPKMILSVDRYGR
jgi:hypothetical protein